MSWNLADTFVLMIDIYAPSFPFLAKIFLWQKVFTFFLSISYTNVMLIFFADFVRPGDSFLGESSGLFLFMRPISATLSPSWVAHACCSPTFFKYSRSEYCHTPRHFSFLCHCSNQYFSYKLKQYDRRQTPSPPLSSPSSSQFTQP